MGDMADMILDGYFCQYCGEPMDDPMGFPGSCGCEQFDQKMTDDYKWALQIETSTRIPSPSNKEIDPKISPRCGKGSCPFYDPMNQDSKCRVYENRQMCSASNHQRRKSANHSRKTALNKSFGT